MATESYAISFVPQEKFDKLSLSQFLLLMTYFCQPKEVAAMKIVQMHRLLKEKGTLTLSMSYGDMINFKNNVDMFAPCLDPSKIEEFLIITESAIVTEDGTDDTGLSQYFAEPEKP